MRFEFCGKLDCPDWILAQLYHASRLDLNRFNVICKYVKETILNDGSLDELSLFKELDLDRDNKNDTSAADCYDIDDARACFGAMNYIISKACQYKVDINQLEMELEQLGLPNEHCRIICELLASNSSQLSNCL